MEKLNYDAAIKAVEEVDGFCGDGKQAVKKIIAALCGVEEKKEVPFVMGGLYKNRVNNDFWIITHQRFPLNGYSMVCPNSSRWRSNLSCKTENEITETLQNGAWEYLGQAEDLITIKI